MTDQHDDNPYRRDNSEEVNAIYAARQLFLRECVAKHGLEMMIQVAAIHRKTFTNYLSCDIRSMTANSRPGAPVEARIRHWMETGVILPPTVRSKRPKPTKPRVVRTIREPKQGAPDYDTLGDIINPRIRASNLIMPPEVAPHNPCPVASRWIMTESLARYLQKQWPPKLPLTEESPPALHPRTGWQQEAPEAGEPVEKLRKNKVLAQLESIEPV